MGRRRSSKTRNLPPNLYERAGYFSWRDPRNGKEYGVGRDRRSAITQAIEANHEVAGSRGERRLVDKLATGPDNSVSAFCDLYEKLVTARLDAGKIRKSSHDSMRQRLRSVRAAWDGRRIDAITTRDVADFLGAWEEAGKLRMAQAVRSLLIDMFTVAVSKGWVAANPVTATKAAEATVRRARLTLDDFQAIHAVAVKEHPAWLARAMELALVTGQRREDIAAMGPRMVSDGRLWVQQGKTGAKVCIPLDIRLAAVGWSLSDVIARCKDNVLSRHFVHHATHNGKTKPGDKVRGRTLAAAFAEARDASGRTWPGDATPPSFHEIRSLAARLYAAQGTDAQALLGHRSPTMTAVYRDARGAEWVEVKTG
ncbi:MAG TPA: phage integrase Arm DNA-binding domain-containing protein [Azospirillum sp.]|nr:phage integrase Arm DNA-binding domain-containing protein [Azospirillum sp.]